MSHAVIRELWTYPVKGCQGVSCDALEVSPMGIPGDRSFVVWEEGVLVDQIETPQLAAIGTRYDVEAKKLVLSHATGGELTHRVRDGGEARKAKWILDEFETIDQGDEAAGWISEVLGKKVRLVAPGKPWRINFPIPQMERVHDREKQSFFSASPVSLANRASLEDLNGRLDQPVPMDRFRMNVVVEGLPAWEEDRLECLSNDAVSLLQVTPAERCVIVTTDQQTGERRKSDLLKKLPKKAKEDSFGSGRTFGSYMTVRAPGRLSLGDRLLVGEADS